MKYALRNVLPSGASLDAWSALCGKEPQTAGTKSLHGNLPLGKIEQHFARQAVATYMPQAATSLQQG